MRPCEGSKKNRLAWKCRKILMPRQSLKAGLAPAGGAGVDKAGSAPENVGMAYKSML